MPCISIHRQIVYQFHTATSVQEDGAHRFHLPASAYTQWESFSLHQFHASNGVEIVHPSASASLLLSTHDGSRIRLQTMKEVRGRISFWKPVIALCAEEDDVTTGYNLEVMPATADAILRVTLYGHVYPETPHHTYTVTFHEGCEIVCVHERGRGDTLWSIPLDKDLPTQPA